MLSPQVISVLQFLASALFLIFAAQLMSMPKPNWRRTTLAIVATLQAGLILGLNIIETPAKGQFTFVGLLFFMLLLVNMTHDLIVKGLARRRDG